MKKKYMWTLGVAWLVCMVLLFSVWPVPDPLNDQLSQEGRVARIGSENDQDSSQFDRFKAETESQHEVFPEVGDEDADVLDKDVLAEEDGLYEEDPDPIANNW